MTRLRPQPVRPLWLVGVTAWHHHRYDRRGLGWGWALTCFATAAALFGRRIAMASTWLLVGSGALVVPLALAGTPERTAPAELALALLTLPLVSACAALAGMAWPIARPSRAGAMAVAAGLAAAVVAGLLDAMAFDARDAGCRTVRPTHWPSPRWWLVVTVSG